jgi:hypothetical protein
VRSKADWEQVKTEYITGDEAVTLETVAKKHEVAAATVRRRAAKEKWTVLRAQYRQQVTAKLLETTTIAEVEARIQHLEIGKNMVRLANAHLLRLTSQRRKKVVVKGPDGKDVEIEEVLPPLANDQATLDEVRRWFVSGVSIQREALGIEELVKIRVEGEIKEALRTLEAVLTQEEYLKVLNGLRGVQDRG